MLKPINHGEEIPLRDEDAAPLAALVEKSNLKDEFKNLRNRLKDLGRKLRTSPQQSLLVILQGRNAGGKDSTTRKVFRKVDPQALQISAFTKPTRIDQQHDFLWRIHQQVPPSGKIGVFIRSHYEDVLVPWTHGHLSDRALEQRLQQINDFERMLTENGVTIVKLFLHISRDEQKQRFLKRLHRPDKHWKFDPTDFDDRERWSEFTQIYRQIFTETSTDWSPWYVVPANHRPTRNYMIAQLLVSTLEGMALSYPPLDVDPAQYEDRL
ncbi:MAG: hypothetical protein Kow00121_57780 [Elainellaceae cyanobacterium]